MQRLFRLVRPGVPSLSTANIGGRVSALRLFSTEESKTGAAASEESANAEGTTENGDGNSADESVDGELTKMQDEMDKLAKAFKDERMRMLAEMENVRRIARRDVEQSKELAIEKFAKNLLDVADNLTRAIESVPKEAVPENDQLKTLYDGVAMTEQQLLKVFASYGIERVSWQFLPGDAFLLSLCFVIRSLEPWVINSTPSAMMPCMRWSQTRCLQAPLVNC